MTDSDQKTILVVDDEADVRNFLKAALVEAGFKVVTASDGFEALDPEIRAVISGYVAGFNRRIAEIKADSSLLPFEFAVLGLTPQDWEVEDVLAWLALLQRSFDPEALGQTQIENAALYQTLLTYHPPYDGLAMFEDLRWLNDPDALTYIPEEGAATSGLMKMRSQSLFKDTHAFPANFEKAAKNMAKIRKNVEKNPHLPTGCLSRRGLLKEGNQRDPAGR